MDYPTIHTNIWGGLIAIPTVVLFTQLTKTILHLKPSYVLTVPTLFGLAISIFISHPHNLSSGIFMGFLYGGAAVGMHASLTTTWWAFRNKS
ncbi:hypothetical protein [Shouchella patagoniensis]|uniref:hypothetical protein n=1 Tax=Shouchella patagoniensis TaxID=228576 RepID=UPI0009949000|nr:hypothetical protein [Shouchella patagoniensis]